jgi:hypothetical protein
VLLEGSEESDPSWLGVWEDLVSGFISCPERGLSMKVGKTYGDGDQRSFLERNH